MRALSFQRLVAGFIEDFQSKKYGKYAGTVTDVDDPEQMGRVRATVPRALGDSVTPWALPCTPYAGPDQGLFAVPPVGSGVWIEFEEGNVERPIWTGAWWPRGDTPRPEEGEEGGQNTKILKTESGLNVALDDRNNVLVVSDGNGANKITIKSDEGQIRVEASGKVVVDARQIELIERGAHPLVFGDDLLVYLNQVVALFNSHTHVGETVIGIPVTPAPPVPPLQPPQPSILSTRVTTG
ncbi:MAG: phage baseplate assembly protein V [Pseudomonadota bacterium]